MNEFIEIEVLTESGIIYNAGKYIEKLISGDYNPDYYDAKEIKSNIENLNYRFSDTVEVEIYNCNQIKKICNYIRPQYGFEHEIYQIEFVDETYRYISQDQYKKLREVLLNIKK